MRKFLLLTAVLWALCLFGCQAEPIESETDPSRITASTAGTPSVQSTPILTDGDETTVPDGTTVGTTVTDPPTTTATVPLPVTTEKAPETTPAPTVTDKPATATTTKAPATTTKPVTTTKKPVTTTVPVTTEPTPAKGTKISVRYTVNDSKGGYLSGTTVQTIRYGETKSAEVKVTANLGYKFVGWNDGSGAMLRSGDMPKENTVYTAIFEVDALELPVVKITTSTGADVTSKTDYIGGTFALSNCDAEFVVEEMEMEIRGRGNFSWRTPKKSYRIKLSEKQNLLGQGEGKAKSWTLIANHCDKSLIRNFITLNFARKLGGLSYMSSATSVDLYLNGEYRGVYLLCEQNQVNKYRVDIPENPESLLTGYFIEMSNYAAENVFYAGGRAYETKNDLSTSPTLYQQQQNYIAGIVQTCWDAVCRGNQAEIQRLLDIASVVDAYIVEELFKNKDDGWDSFYMFYDATVSGEVLHFGPIWDFDLSGGNADEGCENPEGLWAGVSGQMQDNGWFCQLVQYKWFRQLVAERWNELKGEIDKIPAEILAEARRGYNAYNRNFDKWKIFNQRINLEPQQVLELHSYTAQYEYYADWMVRRIAWMDSYLNDPSYAFDGKLTLKGNGTQSSPYLVSSAADFMNLTLCMKNGQDFAGKYFRQTAHIDMTSIANYAGLGKDSSFAGIYDGRGYTIRAVIRGDEGCIFPYVYGTVMNLFTEGSINNTYHASGICRSVRKGGVIVNCGSSMSLTAERAGGIANSNEGGGGIIAGCLFVGEISGTIATSPINCYNDGRGGTFYGNYYLTGLPNSTANVDPSTPKNEFAADIPTMVNLANGNLAETARVAGVNASQLCQWKQNGGALALTVR